MGRFKVFIYIVFFIISSSAIAQPVDTVTFRFERDVATYKVRCQAWKVFVNPGPPVDTSYVEFEISDTLGAAYSFTWTSAGDIDENGVPRVTYQFYNPGTYTFTLSVYEDATGKTYVDTKSFNVRDIIRVPNVFTPNGDGVNDLFTIRANGITPLEISIYSRTGTLIYTSKSPIIVWDGRSSSGALVSEGIYYYILVSDDPTVEAQKGFFYIYGPSKN